MGEYFEFSPDFGIASISTHKGNTSVHMCKRERERESVYVCVCVCVCVRERDRKS